MIDRLFRIDIHPDVEAFSSMRDAELPYPVLQPHQTHGTVVKECRPGMTREDLEGVDALMTDVPGFAIAVRTADCVPVFMYDPVHKCVSASHSGWKGTVRSISARTLEAMKARYGTNPEDVLAVIGPSIGPDSFQVGPEVVEAFVAAGFPESIVSDRGSKVAGTMQGGLHIDLWAACRHTLQESGVQPENIRTVGIDTYESNDRFYSARREGISCGRIINSIKLI